MLKVHAYFFLLCLACAPLFLYSNAGHPFVGYSVDELRGVMGKETGSIDMRYKEILVYPRGKVTFIDGVVSEVALISEEALRDRLDEKRRLRKVREDRMRRLDQEWIEQGRSLKAQRLSDPEFLSLSLKRQIAYWKDFKSEYPEVDIEADLTKLIVSLQEKREKAENYNKLNDAIAQVESLAEKNNQLLKELEKKDQYAPPDKSYFNYGTYTPAVYFNNINSRYYCSPRQALHTYSSRTHTSKPILNVRYKSGSFAFNYSSGAFR